MKIQTRTPISVNHRINWLLAHVPGAQQPIYVSVSPATTSQPSDCFSNVLRVVEEQGGRLICGWSITEWPNVLDEAEFHGIWESPDGGWADLTPNQYGESRILFVPEQDFIYERRIVDNIRVAVGDSKEIDELVELRHLMFQLKAACEDDGGGSFHPTQGEEREYQMLEMSCRKLVSRIRGSVAPIPRLRANSEMRNLPCPCNSNLKFKKCHGAMSGSQPAVAGRPR